MAKIVSRLNLYFAVVAFGLAGCASGSGLLEPTANSSTFSGNPLALPPQDAFATASPSTDQDDNSPESDGAPSLTELNSFAQPGIDPAVESKKLEREIQSSAIDPGVKWRGRTSEDGFDLVNISGVMCSSSTGANPKSKAVNLACSDGRMAILKLNAAKTEGTITVGNSSEKAMLENGAPARIEPSE